MKHTAMSFYEQVISSPFVIGALGALTAMLSGSKIPWYKRLSMGIAGALSAGFVSPALCKWWGIEAPEYLSMIAFFTGMIGLQITGGVIKLGEDIKKNPGKYIPKSWKKDGDTE
jgi:hypothetical protein